MKAPKGRRWALGLAVLAALSVVACAVALRERVYELWQVHRLRTDGWLAARSAAEWLSERGSPESLPGLIELGQAELMRTALARHRERGLPALGRYLREREGEAPSRLIQLLDDAIINHGVEWIRAPAFFAEALASKDENVRAWAAAWLGSLGSEGRLGIPALAAVLDDAARTVRAAALQALIEIGSPLDARTRDAMLQGLVDETFKLQEAIRWLASWSRTEPRVIEDLLCWNEASVRELALETLWELEPSAAARAPSLRRLLADSDPDLSHSAGLLLARAGLELEAAAPIVLRVIDDPYALWWLRALKALPGLGACARQGVPSLIRTLKTNRGEDAAESLAQLGPIANAAAPALLETLEAPETWRRLSAARALPEIVKDTGPAIRALEARLLDRATEVRVRSAASLIVLEPGRRRALLPVIESALNDEEIDVRKEAVLALTRLDGASAMTSGRLIELGLLDDDFLLLFSQALRTTDTMDLAPLCGALRGGDWRDRRRAGKLIVALGPRARAATADLIQALGDGDASVRAAAAAALGSIDPDPAQARPALEKASRDVNQEVRLQARKALEKLRCRPQGERRT